MKYIKEFKENHRDYSYIKERLIHLYKMNVDDRDLVDFEASSSYNEKLTNAQYILKYILYSMSSPNTELSKYFLPAMYDLQVEDVGTVNMGMVSGMGPVMGSTPSSVPGQTTSAGGFSTQSAGDSFGNGGITGSGDIGSGWAQSVANNKNIRKRDTHLPRSRRKNKALAALKAMKAHKTTQFTVKPNNEVDFKKSNIKSFTDFFGK